MQSGSREQLSRLRKSLTEMVNESRKLVHILSHRQPMVKGSIYEMQRKCGKPNCRCAKGQPHSSMVLSWSEGGRTRLLSVPEKKLDKLRLQTEQYQQFRKARTRLVQLHKSMLEVINRIEEARRIWGC
jgi:hypothetical protein